MTSTFTMCPRLHVRHHRHVNNIDRALWIKLIDLTMKSTPSWLEQTLWTPWVTHEVSSVITLLCSLSSYSLKEVRSLIGETPERRCNGTWLHEVDLLIMLNGYNCKQHYPASESSFSINYLRLSLRKAEANDAQSKEYQVRVSVCVWWNIVISVLNHLYMKRGREIITFEKDV